MSGETPQRKSLSLVAVAGAVAAFENSNASFEQSASLLVLRNFTAEGLLPFLKHELYESGIAPRIELGDHDVIRQVALDPRSILFREHFDGVVVALVLEALAPGYRDPRWSWESTWKDLLPLLDDFAQAATGRVVLNTFLPLFQSQSSVSTGVGSGVVELNRALSAYVEERRDKFALVDWNCIARLLGEKQSIDLRYWYQARAPFRPAFLRLYASEVARLVASQKGVARKCLVLDCDNTLWGGVVGEDGLAGIQLDPNEYPGSIYYDFQVSVRNCVEAGAVLALCSKNNKADVFEVIDSHPHCLIRRTDIAAWRINWRDKASNLIELADELRLGLDSFVFVDDQAVECERVSRALPEVEVLRVPEALSALPDLLARRGLFTARASTAEDRSRTELYQRETRRRAARDRCADLEEFLRSLELRASVGPACNAEIPRVAQLTQKTNQFNLTTRRYSEAQIRELIESPDAAVLVMRVCDRFGDAGLTGVVIAKRSGPAASVDSMLLSCRVLGRSLERAFLDECTALLEREWHLDEWRAEYLPTAKNAQVADFWDRAGFALEGEPAALGRKTYRLNVGDRTPAQIPWIAVERARGAHADAEAREWKGGRR